MIQNSISVNFIVPIWGKKYTNLFLTFCLPSLLSKNNLKNINNEKNVFTICTTKEDKNSIEQSLAYELLKKTISVNFVLIDDILMQEEELVEGFRCQYRFLKMTKIHNEGIKSTEDKDMAYSFIMPDNIFFDGALSNAIEILSESNRVIYSYGLHVKEEKLEKSLDENFMQSKSILKIDTFNLAKLALKNLHQASKCSLVETTPFLPNGNLFFKIDENMLLKMCYLHPLFVYPLKKGEKIPTYSTFDDGNYIKDIKKENTTYILDSKICFMYSLDSQNEKTDLKKYFTNRFNIFEQASRIKTIDSKYLENLKKSCILYTKNTKVSSKKIKEIDDLVKYLFFLFNNKNTIPDVQKIKVDCITSSSPVKVYEKCINDLLEILKLFIKNKKNEFFEKIYKDIFKIKEFTCKQNLSAFDALKKIEEVFDIINYGNKTNIFEIDKVQQKVEKVNFILEKHKRVSIYAAGDDTKILLKLINNQDKVCCIFDENATKVGEEIFGKKIELFSFEEMALCEKEKVIIISSTLYEDIIFDKLSSLKNLILYKLND